MLLAERAESERLRQIIKELQRHRFGRRAESLPEDQLLLALEEAEQVEAAGQAESEATALSRDAERARRRAGRTAARFRRICRGSRRSSTSPSTTCPCCSGALHRIGEDVAERLDIVPAQFRVLVVRRPKYACRACEDVVVQAPAPARLIEGGLPTEATVAQVLVSKYADHLPLYRQAQIYARQGVNLGSLDAGRLGRPRRLPAAAGARAAARQAEGLARSCSPTRRRRRCSIPAAAGPRPASSGPMRATTGRGAAPIRRASPMSMRPTARPSGRSRISPASRGILQVDGYGGYKVLAERGEVQLAFCWAMSAAASTNSRRPARRRSPARR